MKFSCVFHQTNWNPTSGSGDTSMQSQGLPYGGGGGGSCTPPHPIGEALTLHRRISATRGRKTKSNGGKRKRIPWSSSWSHFWNNKDIINFFISRAGKNKPSKMLETAIFLRFSSYEEVADKVVTSCKIAWFSISKRGEKLHRLRTGISSCKVLVWTPNFRLKKRRGESHHFEGN